MTERVDFGYNEGGLSFVVNLRKRPEGDLDFRDCL